VEQILALILLEQFLHILPSTNTETKTFSLEIRQRLLTLREDLKRDPKRPGYKVKSGWGWLFLIQKRRQGPGSR
jgi:hypothetical protein